MSLKLSNAVTVAESHNRNDGAGPCRYRVAVGFPFRQVNPYRARVDRGRAAHDETLHHARGVKECQIGAVPFVAHNFQPGDRAPRGRIFQRDGVEGRFGGNEWFASLVIHRPHDHVRVTQSEQCFMHFGRQDRTVVGAHDGACCNVAKLVIRRRRAEVPQLHPVSGCGHDQVGHVQAAHPHELANVRLPARMNILSQGRVALTVVIEDSQRWTHPRRLLMATIPLARSTPPKSALLQVLQHRRETSAIN